MTTLDALQERLAQALHGAHLADDRELAAIVRDEGHRLVFLLSGLVRATRVYDLDNDALAGPTRELTEVLSGLVDRLGVVHGVLVEGQAYVNDVRLRVRSLEQMVVEQFAAELDRHEVGGLSFHHRLEAPALKQLARAIARPAESPNPAAALSQRLSALGDIEVSGRWRFRMRDEQATPADPELAWRVVEAVRDTLGRLGAGRTPNPLRLRRVVIDLVGDMSTHPGQAALAPFAGRPGASERHLISVCQLSLMLGRSLGLSEAALSDLGVAALLHDVGYLVSKDPVRHALAGTRLLIRQRGFSDAKIRRLRCTLEHHYADQPGRRAPEAVSLFARILHVADDYDLLVAPRLHGDPSLSPASALRRMWAGRGTRYDGTLLAAFARELGLYPPGTLLELSDRSLAIVLRSPSERARWAHPVVRVVRVAVGSAAPAPGELDLYDRRDDLRVCSVVAAATEEPLLALACQEALDAV